MTASPMIGGRFLRVGERVAIGMAEVWKAYDSRGEFGEVAIKLLPAGTEDFHRRAFERERNALELLRHPNVVPVLYSDIDAETGQPDEWHQVGDYLDFRVIGILAMAKRLEHVTNASIKKWGKTDPIRSAAKHVTRLREDLEELAGIRP